MKARDAVLLGVTLLLLVLQAVVLGHPLVHTDIATIIVVYLTLERAVLTGAVLALVVGYLTDLFSGTSHGLYASVMVLAFFVTRLLVAQMLGEGILFITAVTVFATTLTLFSSLIIQAALGGARTSLASVTPALPSLLMSAAILGYPCYRLFKALDAPFDEPDDEL